MEKKTRLGVPFFILLFHILLLLLFLLFEQTLDVGGNVLLDVVLLEGSGGAVNSVLLHVLAHCERNRNLTTTEDKKKKKRKNS